MISAALFRRVKASYSMADALAGMHLPYVLGGGHNVLFTPDPGVDCSALVSIALHAGGLLSIPRAKVPLVTQGFEGWGMRGPGLLLTVYVLDVDAMLDLPVHAALAGRLMAAGATHHCALRFTLGEDYHEWLQATHPGGPVGWVDFDPSGFNARHWPGT